MLNNVLKDPKNLKVLKDPKDLNNLNIKSHELKNSSYISQLP